jgi:hypothetical protein
MRRLYSLLFKDSLALLTFSVIHNRYSLLEETHPITGGTRCDTKWAQAGSVSVRNAVRKPHTIKVYPTRMSDAPSAAEKCCVKVHIIMNFSKRNAKTSSVGA